MPTLVIDACAMIAYLEDENGADVVEGILTDPTNTCVAHVVNLGELYTYYLKNFTEADALEAVRLMIDDAAVAKQRGEITSTISNPATGRFYSIALADCFALALAQRVGGPVVTSDDEFTFIRDSGRCPVIFFRPPGTPSY